MKYMTAEECNLMPISPEIHDEEVPSKTVVADITVTVRCQCRWFDFSGRTDSRFMRHMISDMAPRHLVIVHGSPKACRSFQDMAERELVRTYRQTLADEYPIMRIKVRWEKSKPL